MGGLSLYGSEVAEVIKRQNELAPRLIEIPRPIAKAEVEILAQ
jgi:hypothetical protein